MIANYQLLSHHSKLKLLSFCINTPTPTQLLSPCGACALRVNNYSGMAMGRWNSIFICFPSSGGKGVGRDILLVGVLLLLSESQAGILYAMTPAGSIGRCGDDGQ